MNGSKHTIGIVTIDGYTNYGNRLQNYALTKVLEDAGYKVKNGIRVYTKEKWIQDSRSFWKQMIKRMIPLSVIRNSVYAPKDLDDTLMEERQERFKRFVEAYTVILDPIVAVSNDQAYRTLNEYGIDQFITGSDQVWNPYYEGRDYEFLAFAPSRKRLSYAASFGADEIPDRCINTYKKYLFEMKYLSVREEKGAEIIEQLTGRKAQVSLDPTLLLDRNQWVQVSAKPDIDLERDYICTYFLGEVPDAAKKFIANKGLPAYRLNNREERELFIVNPAEFLYMIQNAAYVLTDSFHAVVFSIIFRKEFYVFRRIQDNANNMFSRIDSITKRLGLENRIQSCTTIDEQDPIDNWDWIHGEIRSDKRESLLGLFNALES